MTNRRRPRGEGSVYRKGNKWVARLYVGSHRLHRTVGTQREALAVLAELKRGAGLAVAPTQYTIASALSDFMEHGRNIRGWAPATERSYESAIRLHLQPELGKRKLTELRVPDVQLVLNRLVEAGHSARHVAHIKAVLRAAIAHAERLEVVSRNVATLATTPPQRKAEVSVLSVHQVRALLAELEGHRLRALVAVASLLGLRRGELIALRWDDVDLEARTLAVRRTGTRIGGMYVEGPPKSARSRRTIVVPELLSDELRRHSALIAEERLGLGPHWQDEGRVFPGASGGPIGATTIRKTLNRALAGAGLPHMRIHDLRHTAATVLLIGGGSLLDAQELLGHSTQTLTADTYAHVLDSQRRATADRIDRIVRG